MTRRKWMGVLAVLAVAAVASWGAVAATSSSAAPKLTKVTLQLKWVPQAQFAGYYAAEQGFYTKAGLDVTIKNGGPDIIPERSSIGGGAVRPRLAAEPVATREKGSELV